MNTIHLCISLNLYFNFFTQFKSIQSSSDDSVSPKSVFSSSLSESLIFCSLSKVVDKTPLPYLIGLHRPLFSTFYSLQFSESGGRRMVLYFHLAPLGASDISTVTSSVQPQILVRTNSSMLRATSSLNSGVSPTSANRSLASVSFDTLFHESFLSVTIKCLCMITFRDNVGSNNDLNNIISKDVLAIN